MLQRPPSSPFSTNKCCNNCNYCNKKFIWVELRDVYQEINIVVAESGGNITINSNKKQENKIKILEERIERKYNIIVGLQINDRIKKWKWEKFLLKIKLKLKLG